MTDYQNDDDDVEELNDSEGGGMSFLEHLEDFRWTVGRSVLAFATGIVLATLFIGDIAAFLKMPIVTAYGSAEMADENLICLLYTSPSPRDVEESRMPSSA